MKKKKNLPLSNIPSKLIRQAVEDLEWVMGRPDIYEVNMAAWHGAHVKSEKKVCNVCAAGAVIARRLRISPLKQSTPSDFPTPIFRKLIALNYFREGFIEAGLCEMGITDRHMSHRSTVPYTHDTRHQFLDQLLDLANQLEKEGL